MDTLAELILEAVCQFLFDVGLVRGGRAVWLLLILLVAVSIFWMTLI